MLLNCFFNEEMSAKVNIFAAPAAYSLKVGVYRARSL